MVKGQKCCCHICLWLLFILVVKAYNVDLLGQVAYEFWPWLALVWGCSPFETACDAAEHLSICGSNVGGLPRRHNMALYKVSSPAHRPIGVGLIVFYSKKNDGCVRREPPGYL